MRPAEPGPRRFRLRRGRNRAPQPPPRLPYPLSDAEASVLAQYNGRVAEGVMHTGYYQAEMARLQRVHDRWARRNADRWNTWAIEHSDLPADQQATARKAWGLG